MIFFPIFFVALAEFIAALVPPKPMATARWFWVSTASIGLLLVFVKFTDAGQAFYRMLVEPLTNSSLASLTVGGGGAIADPWDLLALLLAPIPIWIGNRYRAQGSATPR